MRKPTIIIFWALATLIIFGIPFKSNAATFDPEYIISDHELTGVNTMNLADVQSFLDKSGSFLGSFKTQDVDGRIKSAAEIIYRASQEYTINPQFLITLLQREKSLITKAKPTQDDLNWATGFTCYDYSNPVGKFRGFAIQVDRAAWRFRYYLNHPWQFEFSVGEKDKTLVNRKDRSYVAQYGKYVSPKNQVTAGLYNYAPHLYDNWLFWKIWQNWFAKENVKFSDGTLLRAKGEQGVWLVQNGQRRPFLSKNVFLMRFSFKEVEEVSVEGLASLEIAEPMTFPNYSLVQASTGDLFMLANNQKRAISEAMFKKIGYQPEEIIQVDETDLKYYGDGPPIASPYPTGALLQDKLSKAVYYVEEDIKYPMIDATILLADYPYAHIIKVESEELANYKTGEPLKLKGGSLVKSAAEPTVYVIDQGKKCPIVSAETFETLGYQWNAVLTVPNTVLDLHPLGEVLEIRN